MNAGKYFTASAYCKNLGTIFRREHYHNTFIPFSIVFQVNSPFWESLILNSFSFNRTTTLQEEIIYTGSATGSPVITISFNSASAVNLITVTFGENVLTISGTRSATNIIRIDSETKEVLLNGSTIDYTGKLPLL